MKALTQRQISYREKLLDPRWQKMRLKIFERDNWSCTKCGDDTLTLHVHHLRYIGGSAPWEYPEELLATLCADCHHAKHFAPLEGEAEREAPAYPDDIVGFDDCEMDDVEYYEPEYEEPAVRRARVERQEMNDAETVWRINKGDPKMWGR